MKTYKELNEAFGKEALQKKLADKGFGTKSREDELLARKKEMEERHAKADAEMAERSNAWKEKYGNKLKEGFFSLKKKVTARELALKNNAPKRIIATRQSLDEPIKKVEKSERSVNKADQQDKQNWSFK